MTPPYADHRERGGYDSDELDALTSDTQDARHGGKRFVVLTVTGFLTDAKSSRKTPPGLSAHVCDTAYLHRVVATYRSEDGRPGEQGGVGVSTRVGVQGAIDKATARAAELNRDAA